MSKEKEMAPVARIGGWCPVFVEAADVAFLKTLSRSTFMPVPEQRRLATLVVRLAALFQSQDILRLGEKEELT